MPRQVRPGRRANEGESRLIVELARDFRQWLAMARKQAERGHGTSGPPVRSVETTPDEVRNLGRRLRYAAMSRGFVLRTRVQDVDPPTVGRVKLVFWIEGEQE